jgi:hypothetical protein
MATVECDHLTQLKSLGQSDNRRVDSTDREVVLAHEFGHASYVSLEDRDEVERALRRNRSGQRGVPLVQVGGIPGLLQRVHGADLPCGAPSAQFFPLPLLCSDRWPPHVRDHRCAARRRRSPIGSGTPYTRG